MGTVKIKDRTAKSRAKKEKTDYAKALKRSHKASARHVIVLEADMPSKLIDLVYDDSEYLRKLGDWLTDIMGKRLEQLKRTKKYRRLLTAYDKCRKDEDDKGKALIAKELQAMQEEYGVTWDECQAEMLSLNNESTVDGMSIFALSRAEDIWRGVEDVLYSSGERLHFKKYGDHPAIRARQSNRGIPIEVKNDRLHFHYRGHPFSYFDNDKFVADETDAIMRYLNAPGYYDKIAADLYMTTGQLFDTYRPCYATLVCQEIRGKRRVFIHITVEGKAMPKYRKVKAPDGTVHYEPRRTYGQGNVGVDIGTQTIAYTTDTEVGLKNLAERGRAIEKNERMQRNIYRKMDRSRRATDPQNYNEDGTIKKGKKTWTRSKRYMKLQKKHQELCRINAENRHLAINEDVNHLRTLGDVFITEPKNASKLKKKAAPETQLEVTPSQKMPAQEPGSSNVAPVIEAKDVPSQSVAPAEPAQKRNKRRKRFGRSIQNRCPGYLQTRAQQVFESTGGEYHEVPNQYRASQYDHTSDQYVKKKLSDRMFKLSDGTLVQRDWYSSFLLYCAKKDLESPDRKTCLDKFPDLYSKEVAMVKAIAFSGHKVMNSGIKPVSIK